MINYSIIIPHKNCPQLLERCISSIPHRDDLEIIVVDDNSENVDFNEIQSLKRGNVKLIINKISGGGGSARNIGLSAASGRWVLFSDSDDTFCTNELDCVLDSYKDDTHDLIFFNIRCLENETFAPLDSAKAVYTDYIDSEEDAIDKCKYLIRVPWGKLIKKDLITQYNIKFDETKVGNDAWFSLLVGYHAKNVTIDKVPIYNWLVRKGSVTSHRDRDAVMTHFKLTVKLNKFKESKGYGRYRDSLFVYLPMMLRSGVPFHVALCNIIDNTSMRNIPQEIKDFFRLTKAKILR